jgi:hypothetical protein
LYLNHEVSLNLLLSFLSPADFQAAASKYSGGSFNPTPDVDSYSCTLNANYFSYINNTPQPQFRLRFKLGDDTEGSYAGRNKTERRRLMNVGW